MKPLDPRLLTHARAVRRLIAGSVFTGVATTAVLVVQAVVLADLIGAVALDGRSLAGLGPQVILLGACLLGRAALGWAGEQLARRGAARMTAQLRRAVLRQVLRLGPRWTARQRTADLSSVVTAGIDGLENYAMRYLPQLVLAAVVPVVLVAWVFTQDPLSAVVVAVTLPLIPVFMALVGRFTQHATRRRLRTLDLLSGRFLDLVSGLPTLKVFGRARSQAKALQDSAEEYRTATMATLRLAFLSALVLELLATLSVALVAVEIGLRLVTGGMTLSVGLAVLILVPEAYLPLRAVGAQFHASLDGLVAADRVFAVLDEPVPAAGIREDVRLDDEDVAGIRLRGVVVRFTGAPTAAVAAPDTLVPSRGVTVVRGPSGAGKSTLLLVLAGVLQPDEGEVSLRGVPVPDIEPGCWRAQVAYVGQRPRLVAGSVRENLLLGNPTADDEQMHAALRAASAQDVAALPGGLDAPVGAEGSQLSVGQRQRLTLARALLRPASLLLLDEPTSALDSVTEQHVLSTLVERGRSQAVLIASHRPTVLHIADTIIDLGTKTCRAAQVVVHA